MAARHSKDAHKLLQQRMQKLQEGLPPQGQQYSYKAAAAVSKHLAIVDACLEASLHILQQPIPKPEHLSLIGQLLGVLNQYLAWSLLGLDRSRCAAVGHGTTQAPHGSSSGDASSSSNTTGHPGQPCACCASGSCHAAGQEDLLHTEDVHVYTCLQHTYKLLLAVRGARKSGVEQAIAPELLAPGTGTFSLLARAADLLRAGPQSKRRSCLGAAVFDVWIFAERLPCGHHNDDLWARLSCPTQEIPAIAQLLHVTLQQQGNQRPADIRGVSRAADVCLVADMVRKLVWGCATAGWGQVPAGSGLHGQEQSQTALRQAAGALGAVLQEGGPGQVLVDKRMSAAERALVERFLWHALATATAMLSSAQARQLVNIRHSESTFSAASSCGVLRGGAGYAGLSATGGQATRVLVDAATALLCLAAADCPYQHLSDVAVAAAWLRLESKVARHSVPQEVQAAPIQATAGSSSSSASAAHQHVTSWSAGPSQTDLLAAWSQQRRLPAAGYLAWPQPPGLAASSTTRHMRSGSSGAVMGIDNSCHGDISTTVAQAPIGSSRSTTLCKEDALGSKGRRVELLAHAVVAWWPHLYGTTPGWPADFQLRECVNNASTLLHLLVLLVQQLQGTSTQFRAEFLGGPAGGTMLHMLSMLSLQEGRPWQGGCVLMQEQAPYANPLQQQARAGGAGHCCEVPPAQLVQMLLLPGLLLQPACLNAACAEDSRSNSGNGQQIRSCSSSRASQSSRTRSSSRAGSAAAKAYSSTSDSGDDSSSGLQAPGVVTCCPGALCASQPDHLAAPSACGDNVVLTCGEGVVAPLVLLPHSALQLAPGLTPPPAAFFLVEQLLRGKPSSAALHLALQLLQGCVSLVTAEEQPQQQLLGKEQGGDRGEPGPEQPGNAAADDNQAGCAELARLAYCSLATSVVQTVVHNKQLGAGYAGQLLPVAAALAQAAGAKPAALGSSSNGGSNGTRSGAGVSFNRGGIWGLAASLAAATAAGAYAAHMDAASAAEVVASDGCSDNISSTESTDAGGDSPAGSNVDSGPCPAACSMCASATHVFTALRCLEHGATVVSPPTPAMAAKLAQLAQQRGTTLQQHLKQLLLALAWRHPVPYVCGNVLCGRLEGSAAMGLVRNRAGTLCGGSRAAWYCCEGCQQAACAAHRAVCGGT